LTFGSGRLFSLDRGGSFCLEGAVPFPSSFEKGALFFKGGSAETEWQRMEVFRMDNFTFGVTMLICGMGGTILTLWIMSLVMGLLGRLFPEVPAQKKEE
jgi:hypothetical protein